MKTKILRAYPGFTRRAVTFTMDDGIIKFDKMLIDILRPHGIKGTFNLCTHRMDLEDGFYREFYRGFGIANHTYRHPYAMNDAIEYTVCDGTPCEDSPSESNIYPVPDSDGFYIKMTPRGPRELSDNQTYIDCVKKCQSRLEAIFGKQTVKGFVWPYSEQNNSEIVAFLHGFGFTSIRKTGDTLDTTGFAIPEDRMRWSYNCHHTNLLELMEKYDNLADDGSLKFFAFGVHSFDFEYANKWEDLRTFAEKYGNRQSDFWYATVDEIFDYADAMERLIVTDNELKNPTDLTLCVELDGQGITLPPHSVYSI